ncbi:MAG: MBL fold metallo-hydrolase RNA specificity domain-containing protein [Desulfomonilaceae bacterium]
MIKVTCFGAARSVTGSNYLIETPGGVKFVVDCGLFQGSREIERQNWYDWGYDPKQIKNVILTHAHIDHSGRIPKLVKDGFSGRIITSPPTAELCRVMLLDSAHVQEMEAEWQSRRNRRQAKTPIQPLYTKIDAEKSLEYLNPVELDEVIELEPGVEARLRNSGHVLGSCAVEIWVKNASSETKIVFSGDLGKQDQLIVKDPFKIGSADYVFVESTYGNRLHRSFEASKAEFLEAIKYAVSNNEKVIIPAFALERTQEIIYVLGEFSREGKIPQIPIFLDSPLAIRATEIFRNNRKYLDEEAQKIVDKGLDPFDIPNLKMTLTAPESMKINEFKGSAIIISANGMCSAGRIKHHLKHNLWRPGSSLVIVGFQGEGTTGRQIVEGAKSVRIFGEKVAVRAKVFTIGGFSAHADQADLLNWISHFDQKPAPKVFVIHGEPLSVDTFANKVRKQFGFEVYSPRLRETLQLELGREVAEILPPVEQIDLTKDSLELTAELEIEIQRLKKKFSESKKGLSQDDFDRLREIREELQSIAEN